MKVIDETPLTRKDEENLRKKVEKILIKVNKASETPRLIPIHPSASEDMPSASSSQLKLDVSTYFKSENYLFKNHK